MGKASAPSPPDYTPIAQADAAQAQQEYQLGQQQLSWAQNQFNTVWPYAQQYMQSEIGATNAEQQAARQQQKFYNRTYKPIERQFANQAANYDSGAQENYQEGLAESDVTNQFDAARNSALSSLESYGIDPSQTRFGALDLGSRISQAAATAAAGTQSRLNTQATGMALEGEAINIGRGYPSSIAQSYNTATNAGSSGISTANQTTTTGASTQGTPIQYGALGNQSSALETQALNTGFNNALASDTLAANENANFMSGLGNILGGGMTIGALAGL